MRWARGGVLWILLASLAGCAGYQLGSQSLYPTHIRTVHVPIFESRSFRRNQGERLTEAVVKQIEAKTPYKVVHTPDADSVLSGQIAGDTKRVVVGTLSGEPRDVEVGLQVEVSWLDRRGNALRPAETVPLPPELVGVGASATLLPEVGQSVATAQQQAIERVAEQIVSLMENPW
ncbi:MAG: LptE family protein [Pirellulales bacterium]|nr:LptE family protein [Pirellulales bacterium]